MSHEIKEADLVFTVDWLDRAWHRLDIQKPKLDRKTLEPIFFPLEERPIFDCSLSMEEIDLFFQSLESAKTLKDVKAILASRPEFSTVAGWKLIFGNLSHREDLPKEFQRIPMQTPKESYTPISNLEAWEFMQKALKDVPDAETVSAGTLDNGKYFFASVQVKGQEFFAPRKGDKIQTLFNLITSHNGSTAVELFESSIRIVCMNTFRWSRQAQGDCPVWKVRHTENAFSAMGSLADSIAFMLKAQDATCETLKALDTVSLSHDEMRGIATAYQMRATKKEGAEVLTSRSLNTVNGIVTTAVMGKGNAGRSAYDLFNGATEYWTSGNGVGASNKGINKASRVAKSEFGAAMEHKRSFLEFLCNEDTGNALSESELQETAQRGLTVYRKSQEREFAGNVN